MRGLATGVARYFVALGMGMTSVNWGLTLVIEREKRQKVRRNALGFGGGLRLWLFQGWSGCSHFLSVIASLLLGSTDGHVFVADGLLDGSLPLRPPQCVVVGEVCEW